MRSFYVIACLALAAISCAAEVESEEFWDNSFKEEPNYMGGEDLEKLMSEDAAMKSEGPVKVEYVTKPFTLPDAASNALLWTTFQDSSLPGWLKLSDKEKYSGEVQIKAGSHNWLEGDTAMQLMSKSAHHGLARQLVRAFDPKKDDSLYASVEVQYEEAVNCGGAYFKLFKIPPGKDASSLTDQTPYAIMFGPDKCGHMTNKVHFIVKHPHPMKDGEYVEDHLSGVPRLPEGQGSHQYGFEVRKDGTMKLYVDHKVELEGNMKTLFQQPAFENQAEIDDPEDEKPADWVDEKRIPDPDAVKPEDWDENAPEMIPDMDATKPEGWLDDEPLMIPNPEAEKPADWDDEEDGEWKTPMVKNPACYVGCGEWTRPKKQNPDYKGKWVAPKIDNPEYQGEWKPRKIENPEYYSIENPYNAIPTFNAVGFEVWTVDSGAMIDNLIITTDGAEFHKFIDQTWEPKHEIEKINNEKKQAAEKAQQDQAKSKAQAAAEASTSASTFFGIWKNLAQQSMTTLILTVTLPVATTLWIISKVLKSRYAAPAAHATAVETAKKDDDAKKEAHKKEDDKKDGEGDTATSTNTEASPSEVKSKAARKASREVEEMPEKATEESQQTNQPRQRKQSNAERRKSDRD